jgi:hypothetical protein
MTYIHLLFFSVILSHMLAISHSDVLQFLSCSLKLCKKGDPSGEFIGPVLLYNGGNCHSTTYCKPKTKMKQITSSSKNSHYLVPLPK